MSFDSNTTPVVGIDAPLVADVIPLIDLSQLLLANVNAPSYNLTSAQINWINEFIAASPSSFTQITSDIKAISATGEVGLKNIPQIVKLIADIYNSGAINSKLVNPENTIAFIRFTLDVIFSSPLLVLPDIEKEAIKELVDISLSLLSMNIGTIEAIIDEVESSACFTGCFKFFKCK
jgi:hypothetical protein